MGAYASTASTHKVSEQDTLGPLAYGVSEMQGWRKSMEDTSIAVRICGAPGADVDNAVAAPSDLEAHEDDIYVFGVFDGHGGREVSAFCKRHFAEEMPRLEHWPKRNFEQLLREAFLRMDEMLLDSRYAGELAELRRAPSLVRAPLSPSHALASAEHGARVALEVGKFESGQPSGEGSRPPVEDAARLLRSVLALKQHGAKPGATAEPHLPEEGESGARIGGACGGVEAAAARNGEGEGGLGAAKLGPATPGGGGKSASNPNGGGSPTPQPAADAESSPPATAPPAPAARRVEPWRLVQAGCTAIVACVDRMTLHVANAGDSRCVLCRGGQTIALSEDHKPGQPAELARITAAGGWVSEVGRVNGNLNLSRSIGDLRYKGRADLPPDEQVITAAPEVRSIELHPSDEFCVLACDGVWDVRSSEEVVAFVRERLLRADEAAAGMRAAAAGGSARAGEDLADAIAAGGAGGGSGGVGAAGARGGAGGAVGSVRNPALLSAIVEELFDECISHNPAETGGLGGDNMTMMVIDLRDHVASCGGATRSVASAGAAAAE